MTAGREESVGRDTLPLWFPAHGKARLARAPSFGDPGELHGQ